MSAVSGADSRVRVLSEAEVFWGGGRSSVFPGSVEDEQGTRGGGRTISKIWDPTIVYWALACANKSFNELGGYVVKCGGRARLYNGFRSDRG